MLNKIKLLKEQIEKLGAVPDRGPKPSTSSVTAPARPGVTSPSSVPTKGNQPVATKPVGYGVSKAVNNPTVREMQLSMQDLANAVMQDASSSTMALKKKDTIHQDADSQVQQSKKSFNDFVAEQYMGSLDESNKGVEWSKDPSVVKRPEKQQTQTDIYELDAVMNTLSRIGAERGEFKADGNWDWRTQNALKNMLGFAYALLELEGDFGLSNHVYNIGNWKDFQNTLSGYSVDGKSVDLSDEEKKTKAIRITKHLKAITKLYSDFRQQVIARPEFRPFLEGKRSFDKYDQSGTNKDVLTPNEQQVANSDKSQISGITYLAPRAPGQKLNYIPLKALTSKEEYLKWMLEFAGVPSEEAAWLIFKNIIKPKIEAL